MGFLSKLFSHKSVEEVADEIANTYAEEVQADNAEQTENEPVNMLEVTDTGEIEYTEKTETEQGEPTPQEDMQTDDPSEVRRHIITFRVNDAELAAINRRYEQTSFKSRGDYCRYSALTVMNVEEDNESLLAAARGISSVSNSFNQVAHRVNKTGHLYESDIETMKKGMNEIWQLLTSIRYTKERTMQLLISSTRTKPETAGMLLAATVAVKDSSIEPAVLLTQLFYGVYTEFLLHVVTHFKSDALTVEAVEDRRYIELSVSTLDLGDIGNQFLQRFVCTEVSFDQVLSVLGFSISLCDTVRSAVSVDKPGFAHSPVSVLRLT